MPGLHWSHCTAFALSGHHSDTFLTLHCNHFNTVLTKTGMTIITTSRQYPEKVSALSSSLSSCGVRSIFVDRQLTWLRVNNFWNSVTWSSKGCCYEATFCWLMLFVPRKICPILFNMIPWPNLFIFRQKTNRKIYHKTLHQPAIVVTSINTNLFFFSIFIYLFFHFALIQQLLNVE